MPTPEKPSLPELQRWMRWVLTFPTGVSHVLRTPRGKLPSPRHWTRGPEPTRCLDVIEESSNVSRENRLAIYGDGYFIRIVNVLASNYPSLRNVVGAHEFDHHLARPYLVRFPSTHKCIDNVGSHMAAFLKSHRLTQIKRFLPDLARLEWASHESFYADDWPLLEAATLASIPVSCWSSARVKLDPSVRLLELDYPVVGLWKDNGEWDERRFKRLRRKRTWAVVYRRVDGQVRVMEQTRGAFALLSALHANRSFRHALTAAARSGLSEARTSELFSEWTSAGIIRKVRFG